MCKRNPRLNITFPEYCPECGADIDNLSIPQGKLPKDAFAIQYKCLTYHKQGEYISISDQCKINVMQKRITELENQIKQYEIERMKN
jgi:hypothetical protein